MCYALFVVVWEVFISRCVSGRFLYPELLSTSSYSCCRCPSPPIALGRVSWSLCTISIPFKMSSEQPPSDATDIFSLSDRVLAEKLQFVKEVRSVSLGAQLPLTPTTHIIDWFWKLGQRLVMPTKSIGRC